MTGHDMLKRARELAHDHEKHMAQDGTATMLYDLITEIERLRDAAKGAVVIVNQAVADKKRAEAQPMTFDQFHNAIRVLWNIDRPDWMAADQWFAFNNDPHRFFVKADDETARKLWALIEPRLRP